MRTKPKDTFVNPEAVPLLPAPISKIEVQKKTSSRFSLFIEDVFLIGISDSTLVHFNLRKGTSINAELIQEIERKEFEWKIREYLINLLSRRDHARNELRDKAKRKGYPSNVTDSILDELTDKGYINNLAFAKKFAIDKHEFNQWGSYKIRIELLKKGITEWEIEQALSQIQDEDIEASIHDLVLKNKRKFKRADSDKRRKKVFDFLLRKGYDSDVILKMMPELLKKIEA